MFTYFWILLTVPFNKNDTYSLNTFYDKIFWKWDFKKGKMKISPLFTCFTVTVTENSGKTTLSSNFVFSELKIGVESRGIPIETRRVEMGCTPAWDPLFSTRKHKINAKCHFPTVFCNVTVKQVNIVLFLIFSGQEVHNSTSLMP